MKDAPTSALFTLLPARYSSRARFIDISRNVLERLLLSGA